jgi:site-specific DNA-methyltransferase (adenine-specific)
VASIKDFPKMMELRPIVIDDTMTILGGNMRYNALREAGFEEIPDNWVKQAKDLTEKEKQQFIIKDNLPFGEWDWDILGNNFEIKDLLEWGFDEKDLKIEQEIEEDEAPEVSDEPAISKLGEVYQLGRHRLMCGDSTKIEDVEKLMNGQNADMILTDPPYGIAYKESKNWAKPTYVKRPIIGDDKPFDYTTTAWPKCDIWCVWGANYFCNTIPNFYEGNFIVWAKAHSDIENETFGSSFELAWMYPKHKQTIWYVRRINMGKEEHGLHVTQKPIEVCVRAMKYHSLPEDKIVVDLFGGSGSTLIACEQTNRVCYMCELDEKYVDVIRKRYWKFTHDNKEDGWQEGTKTI